MKLLGSQIWDEKGYILLSQTLFKFVLSCWIGYLFYLSSLSFHIYFCSVYFRFQSSLKPANYCMCTCFPYRSNGLKIKLLPWHCVWILVMQLQEIYPPYIHWFTNILQLATSITGKGCAWKGVTKFTRSLST